jgi:hypothetical protein
MTPQERAERARPGAYKIAEYENKPRTKGYTFLFAQPRSGSTLLMRLMKLACLTNVTGDRPIEFYRSVFQLFYSSGVGKKEDFNVMENNNIFMDTYIGNTKKMCSYHINQALNGGIHYGFQKTTIIGFNNQLTEQFVCMLREMYEDSSTPLTIGFLTRDHDDIVKSFQTRDGPGKETAMSNPDVVKGLLENQYQQFRSSYEIGDVLIKYEDLIQDPIKWLLKLQCQHHPSPSKVEEVMNRVIR